MVKIVAIIAGFSRNILQYVFSSNVERKEKIKSITPLVRLGLPVVTSGDIELWIVFNSSGYGGRFGDNWFGLFGFWFWLCVFLVRSMTEVVPLVALVVMISVQQGLDVLMSDKQFFFFSIHPNTLHMSTL